MLTNLDFTLTKGLSRVNRMQLNYLFRVQHIPQRENNVTLKVMPTSKTSYIILSNFEW